MQFKNILLKRLILYIVIVSLFSACASSSRYIATPSSPPELGISSEDENLNVEIVSLIVPDGLGSWVKAPDGMNT